ncbi:hypothetical protein MTYM_01456 [Methylococcales bacterium]|nr:hypothetical protein MTYM_01456 [Methylococcales bacterium]
MPMNKTLALLLVLLSAASAQADLNGWEGVWAGALGQGKITSCIDITTINPIVEYEGLYYYHQYLSPLFYHSRGNPAVLKNPTETGKSPAIGGLMPQKKDN